MRKKLIWSAFVVLLIIFIIILFKLAICYVTFDKEDLTENYINDASISIIGDYVFYDERELNLFPSKAKNLTTGESKLLHIDDVSSVYFHNGYFYYQAKGSFLNERYYLYRRGINEMVDEKLTDDYVDDFTIYNDDLYYLKFEYNGRDGYEECSNIFRVNLETKEIDRKINQEVFQYYICNDKIYYLADMEDSYEKYKEDFSDAIYCYSLNDKTETVIAEGVIKDFVIENNNIVYAEYTPGQNGNSEKTYVLKLLNLTTGETVDICDNAEVFETIVRNPMSFDLVDNNIVYIDKDLLNVINIYDCTNGAKTTLSAEGNIATFKIYDDNLCYVDDSDLRSLHIYNVTTNSTMTLKLDNFDSEESFVLYNNTLYYYDFRDKFHEKDLFS